MKKRNRSAGIFPILLLQPKNNYNYAT